MKNTYKPLLLCLPFMGYCPAFAQDSLVNNDSQLSFLTWLKEPENREKIEYIKNHFDRFEFTPNKNTNPTLKNPKATFQQLEYLNVNYAFPMVEYNRVYFYRSETYLNNNGKTYVLSLKDGLNNFSTSDPITVQNFKNQLKEKKAEVYKLLPQIDDLFYTDDLKAKTLKIVDKKYKLLELQVDEAYLRGLQLNDPDNQDLARQLEENDVQKAF